MSKRRGATAPPALPPDGRRYDAAGRLGRIRERYGPVLRAWTVFLLWIGLFSAAALAGWMERVQDFLVVWIARVTAATLALLGQQAEASGEMVYAPGMSLEIIPPCTAFLPTLLFLAAVFAFPCRLAEKLVGVAVGVPGIFLINLVRVVSLFYVGLWYPSIFERAHMLVWQPLVIFSAVALWLFWVVKMTRPAVAAASEA